MARIDYKSQNRQYQYMRQSVAKTISERYPDIDHVDVEVSLDFQTAVCPTTPKEHKFMMLPDHKIHLYYDCPNRDCTGSGFDLTSALEDCLRSRKEVTGSIRCNGKEDSKYEHASGCSCMTTCTYKMMPVVK